MHSKPVIYVSRITNLSDARYCAGMGADLLGVVVDPSHADYVSPEIYQQMIGWVSGPKRVAELGSLHSGDLESIHAHYAADYIHVHVDQLPSPRLPTVHFLVEIPFNEYTFRQKAGTLPEQGIAYWIVTSVPDTIELPFSPVAPVLIARSSYPGPTSDFLASAGAAGIALQGSHESAPGLKDYDHLSHVLEELNG